MPKATAIGHGSTERWAACQWSRAASRFTRTCTGPGLILLHANREVRTWSHAANRHALLCTYSSRTNWRPGRLVKWSTTSGPERVDTRSRNCGPRPSPASAAREDDMWLALAAVGSRLMHHEPLRL